jgi:hypothetical protein
MRFRRSARGTALPERDRPALRPAISIYGHDGVVPKRMEPVVDHWMPSRRGWLGLHPERGKTIGHDRNLAQAPPQHGVGIGAQILLDPGLHTSRLLTNHPRRIVALEGFGIEIVDQVPIG